MIAALLKRPAVAQPASWAAMALGAALVVGGLLVPTAHRIGRVRQELATLRAQLAQARQFEASDAAGSSAWHRAKARYETWTTRLGRGQSAAAAIDALSAQAKALNLELVVVQPKMEDAEPAETWAPDLQVRALPLSLEMTGRYRQFGEFLAWLPEAPFVASVDSLTVTRQGESGPALLARLDLTLRLAEGGR